MIIKHRQKTLELILLEYLHARMDFSTKELKRYLNLKKGYEGELKSDLWLDGLSDDWIILQGLLLEINQSTFQIDTLLISQETIYNLDIKNFEGDHYIEGEKWLITPKQDVKNPLHQLNRSQILLRGLLHELGYHYPIESYLIFVNPEFHLYQPTINTTIVYPTQLNRFLKMLNTKPANLQKNHFKLAEKLVALHKVELPYSRLPGYNFDSLKKGIICPQGDGFFSEVSGRMLVCANCGCTEEIDAAVLRTVNELILLFPDINITTNIIQEWCDIIKSKKTLWRILSRHYNRVGSSKSTNYIPPKD
ncbi:hypothetical protein QE429_000238 [Bacillus sp. SORGH_AS 510]|uniref:nuclease-related domain-containing protein n=1 Tax=Bacillus sp. SORGH_AS_0510 TaxID=3041771 RepID=UPI00277D79FE|nr:nuclease-related domain-containing protein [Bacillus sp. SORGH_AS_0510]MDQ1143411.1 hypothetical protein [Bacillus sp. SORGH_AS_0510]